MGATCSSVNQTALSKVTIVKNQGNCGSCWAFSALAGIESALLKKNSTTYDLSEQQAVDCSSSYGNKGCNGGWPSRVYDWNLAGNYITLESIYPYTARTGACKLRTGIFKIVKYNTVIGVSNMLNEVCNRPLAVAVDATNWGSYSSGVFSNCGAQVNHAVLLTGFDKYQNWFIKNSWGTSWGVKGYITLKSGNTCGIAVYPGYSPYF